MATHAVFGSLSALMAASRASVVPVTSSAALGANDLIDWSDLGPDFTSVANPTNGTGVNGLGYTVSRSGDQTQTMEIRYQSSGWLGNFAPGEPVLWSKYEAGWVDVAFANGVFGAGAQFAQNSFPYSSGGVYTARIEAFDAGSNSFGFFTLSGAWSSAGDDPAIFIGVLSANPEIWAIRFSIDADSADSLEYCLGFAIGNVELKTAAADNPIPEPGSLTLLLSGMLAMGAVSLRRRWKNQGRRHQDL